MQPTYESIEEHSAVPWYEYAGAITASLPSLIGPPRNLADWGRVER